MSQPYVRCRELVKQYPGVRALDGASLDVREGEILGLLGKNGAGKSSVIKVLAGLVQPDSGTLEVSGNLVKSGYGPRTAYELGLAFVHQELNNVPDMTVAENVTLGTSYPRRAGVLIDHRRMRREVAKLLDRLSIDVDPNAYVGSLSATQQRLVMIARALHHDARVLVLDEPTVSFTDHEIQHLHQLIRGLRDVGHGIVYVSHRIAEVKALTDRVVVMQDGRDVCDRRTDELDEAAMIEAITGKPAPISVRRTVSALDKHDVPVLRVRNLNAPPRVRDVSFDLHAGEVLGLVGLVGSGRSEVARLIFGADPLVGGTIEVDGKQFRPRNPTAAIANGIGLLPEDRRHEGLVANFSVRANISLASLRRHRWTWTPFTRRSSELLATSRVGTELALKTASSETMVGDLSGGNQQKVVIARWLEADSRILIFDEPAQGVDVGAKEEIFRLIERLAQSGRAIIVISSDFSELIRVCTRVVGIREGRVTGELQLPELAEDSLVRLAYADDASPSSTGRMLG